MIVVIDCNVVISACLSDGLSRRVLNHIIDHHLMVVSRHILNEYSEVAARPKFSRSSAVSASVITCIEQKAMLVRDSIPDCITLPDQDDVPYVAAAIAGDADIIVTGNLKDFPERRYASVRVLSVREFADMMAVR